MNTKNEKDREIKSQKKNSELNNAKNISKIKNT